MSALQLTAVGSSQEDTEQAMQQHSTVEAAVDRLASIASQHKASVYSQEGTHCLAKPLAISFLEEDAQSLPLLGVDAQPIVEPQAATVPAEDGRPQLVLLAASPGAAVAEAPVAEVINGLSSEDTIEPSEEREADRRAAAEFAPKQNNGEAGMAATPWDHAQVVLSQSMSTMRAHVFKSSRKETNSQAQCNVSSSSSDVEVVTGDVGNLPETETHATTDETDNVSKWREMTLKLSAWSIAQRSLLPQCTTADDVASDLGEPVAAVVGRERYEVEATQILDLAFGAISRAVPASTEQGGYANGADAPEANHKNAGADAALLDRAQVFWSESASALRAHVSVLLPKREGSAQEASEDIAAEQVRSSHLTRDQPVGDDPVRCEQGEESQQAPDEARRKHTKAKWHEMASRLCTITRTTIETGKNITPPLRSENTHAVRDSASMPKSSEGQRCCSTHASLLPDSCLTAATLLPHSSHTPARLLPHSCVTAGSLLPHSCLTPAPLLHHPCPTAASATPLDRAQVFVSLSMSALHSKVAAVCALTTPTTKA